MRLMDRFATEESGREPASMHYQIHATREFLEAAEQRTEEVERLLAVVRAADAAQVDSQVGELLSYAEWLEGTLRLDEAADVVGTALRIIGGRDERLAITGHLRLGRVLRHLGRFDESQAYYRRAGELAQNVGDAHAELLSRIGRGIVLQKTGNLPESERLLREVLRTAVVQEDRDAEARACHDLAVCLHHMNRGLEAAPLTFRAFRLYEQPLDRFRALSDTGQILKEQGLYDAAERAFRAVVEGDPPAEIRVRTVVELLDLAALTGDRLSFERCRRAVQEEYERLPVDEQVDFEVKLGSGLARFGKIDEGRAHLTRAIAMAEAHGLPEWLFRAEAVLSETERRLAGEDADRMAAPDLVTSPELRETMEGLEQLCTN